RDLSFAGGMWVFPGGRIDDTDFDPEAPGNPDDADEAVENAARRAAAREAIEESGVEVDPTALRRWSHWTPPPLQDKRFSTAFFVAPAVAADVRVTIDDGEIRAHRWARPDEVIRRRDAGEVALAPPTFITLTQLLRHDSVARILDAAPTGPIEHFSTRVALR
ncbi:MAG: NUDIX domain-containing protein, partial [Acidimicrobiia bacterium]